MRAWFRVKNFRRRKSPANRRRAEQNIFHPVGQRLEDRWVLSTVISLITATEGTSYANVGFANNFVGGFSATVNGVADNTPSDFSAQINWGDSGTSQGSVISLGDGHFGVKGSHIYTQAAGNSPYNVSLNVTGPDGASASGETDTQQVLLMPSGLSATAPLPASPSMAPSNVYVSLTDANAVTTFAGVGFTLNQLALVSGTVNGQDDDTSTDYQAFINYGDSSQWFAASITSGLGVKGSHVYMQAGTYPIVVYAVGPDGTSVSRQVLSATVSAMPSGLAGTEPPTPTVSLPPSDVGVALSDANAVTTFAAVGFTLNQLAVVSGSINGQDDDTSTDYQAFINYGDSSQWFAASITSGLGVKGSHVYTQAGTYPIVVYAVGPDGTSVSRQVLSATVSAMPSGLPGTEPPTSTAALPPSDVSVELAGVGGGQSQSNVGFTNALVATVKGALNGQTDSNAADYQAFINWGDTSQWFPAVINANLQIEGSHTYGKTGTYGVVVYARGPDGTSISATTASEQVTQGPQDTTSPTVTLTQTPPSSTSSTSATFAFSGSDNDTPADQLIYFGSLDGTPFATLTSPVNYSGLSSGTHTFEIEDMDAAGNISLPVFYTFNVVANAPSLNDPGFELPALATGAYRYDPSGSPWTFSGDAGVANNSSAFTTGNPNAPQGSQVAFLQITGSVNQSITLNADTYSISFDAAQRAIGPSNQTFEVLVDNSIVGTFTPSGTSYSLYTTPTFSVTAARTRLSSWGSIRTAATTRP